MVVVVVIVILVVSSSRCRKIGGYTINSKLVVMIIVEVVMTQ